MTIPYATSEESTQLGAPLELYQFRVGASRGRPATAGGSSTVEDFRDEFTSYADTTALLTAYGQYNTWSGATWTLDATGGVGGSKAAKLFVPASSPADRYGPQLTKTLTGLTPLTWHDVTAQVKLSSDFDGDWSDRWYVICGVGSNFGTFNCVQFLAQSDSSLWKPYDTFVTASGKVQSNAAGQLYFRFGWDSLYYFSVIENHNLWWDSIVVSHEEVSEGDPGEDPSDGTFYGYTSADVDVVYSGDTYLSDILIRNNLTAGGTESSAESIEVRVPRDSAVAALALGPPNPVVSLTLIRLHRADLTQAVVPWKGQVVRKRFDGPDCVLTCAGLNSLLARKLPRRKIQKSCMHILGDGLCQVLLSGFTTGDLTVDSVSGNQVTITGLAAEGTALALGSITDGSQVFRNGVLNFGEIKGRIESVSGDVLTLRQTIPSHIGGSTVTLTAGCDNEIATCKNVFDNAEHFGGKRVLPLQNPGYGAGIGSSGGDG